MAFLKHGSYAEQRSLATTEAQIEEHRRKIIAGMANTMTLAVADLSALPTKAARVRSLAMQYESEVSDELAVSAWLETVLIPRSSPHSIGLYTQLCQKSDVSKPVGVPMLRATAYTAFAPTLKLDSENEADLLPTDRLRLYTDLDSTVHELYILQLSHGSGAVVGAVLDGAIDH